MFIIIRNFTTLLVMAVERDTKYWNSLELKSSAIEEIWKNTVDEIQDDFLSMGGALDAQVERDTTRMVLVAPMLDLYIKEIGIGFLSKLGRGRNTGLQPPRTILFPWHIFTHLLKLISRYGGSYELKERKNKEKFFTIAINTEACARKVWHPMRVGKAYLTKRKYRKMIVDGAVKPESRFCGVAKVVVGANTPITITYYTKTQNCTTTFWIQRYDQAMIAMDALVQAKLNE